MSLGHRIYELRIRKHMSQSELAEALDVSRQSVSKWETDAAVPDLDKLIRLCDVFDVSVDELVGRAPREPLGPKEQGAGKAVTVMEKPSALTTAKIVGYILLAATLIAGVLLFVLAEDEEDVYLPLPFLLSTLACSVICLCVKAHVGYWCAWAALAPVYLLTVFVVRLPLLTTMLLTQVVIGAVMTVVAHRTFKGCAVRTGRWRSVLILCGFVAIAAAYVMPLYLSADWISTCIFNCLTYAALALLLTYTVCYIKALKHK